MCCRILLCLIAVALLGCSSAGVKQAAVPVGIVEDKLAYDQPPVLVSQGRLDYPDAAREASAEGKVLIKVLVLADGKVGAVQVIESSHPLLTDSAVEAGSSSVFKPATLKGVPVQATVVMPFVFNMNRSATKTSLDVEPVDQTPSPGNEAQVPPPQPEPTQHITK